MIVILWQNLNEYEWGVCGMKATTSKSNTNTHTYNKDGIVFVFSESQQIY